MTHTLFMYFRFFRINNEFMSSILINRANKYLLVQENMSFRCIRVCGNFISEQKKIERLVSWTYIYICVCMYG